MDDEERKRRIRRLVFASPALARALLAGDYRSAFKGRGMDFDGLREYGTDDDALRMDWNATARLGKPFVKTWRDDRSLSVYLVVDESESMDRGDRRADTARTAASLVAYACSANGVRVGGLFFGGDALEHVEPDTGPRRALALIERVMEGRRGPGHGSRLPEALEAAASWLKRRSLVLIVSDFQAAAYAVPLALLARRHDVAMIHIRDGSDLPLVPDGWTLRAVDAESGRARLVPGRSRVWKGAVRRASAGAKLELLSAAAAARVSVLPLGPSDDPVLALTQFFGRRGRRP